jgi:SagB-type dehydrogenase family enzyme
MLPFEDTTSLSLLYHLNSEPWENAEAYGNTMYEVDYKEYSDAMGGLPLPVAEDSASLRLLRVRESCRHYERRLLPLKKLAALLAGAYGIARVDHKILNGLGMLLRTVPSAGGLFPLEVYVVLQLVECASDGLYHFNVRKHSLESISTGMCLSDFSSVLYAYPFIENANALLFLSAVFARTQRKYGPRGYRYILLEAGHVAQNICLLAAAEGLGSLCMGAFSDAQLNRMLGLDGAREATLYAVAVGQRAS